MATTTKAQLATENAALRSRVSELEGEIARLKARPTTSDFKSRAAAAKAEAIRTGRVIRL
jgi:uncharacterized small protein (DUF1192 family)